MKHRYLFRALRKYEIESGHILIPKESTEFKADPVFGIDNVFPLVFFCEENSVRQHQWKQNGLPTRGVSTTPFFERALYYAQRNRVIVKIDTSSFDAIGIRSYYVNDILGFRPSDIAVPEDSEVILVYEKDGPFPSQIVCEIVTI